MYKSVVIPTLWRCPDSLVQMLDIYQASAYVEEIIIIDNNPVGRPKLGHSKVKLLPQSENIYVNPAWNLGAAKARHGLILANDDIELERLDELIETVAETEFDIVGACNCTEEGDIHVEDVDAIPWVSKYNPDWSCGYGSMMFVKRYSPIPESMKIYFGDNILFDRAGKRGMFHGLRFVNQSATAERTDQWDEIKSNDEKEYVKYLNAQGTGLSVAMIVKNEESCLGACLESVQGVDEIIIVDTGSADNTVEIAKGFTDNVYSDRKYEWRDDFAFSRNQALGKCSPGNWILSIDADETLEKGGVQGLRRLITDTEKRAFSLRLVSEGTGEIHYPTRLFRKMPGVAWTEPIHEVINITDVPRSDIGITYGYSRAHEGDPERSLRILRKAVRKQPENPRRRYYLAREYWYLKDYEKGYYHYDYYTKIGTWPPELADGLLMKARCLWHLQRGHEARGVCLEAIRLNPNFREALLFMAEMHYEPWKTRWASFADLADNSDVLFVRV